MTRFASPAAARVYAAAQRFVDAALRADDSLFTPGAPIWSPPVIDDLYDRFVDHPDESADTFEAKFRRQLRGDALTPPHDAAPATYQLAGELLYIHLLPANGIGGATKWKRHSMAALSIRCLAARRAAAGLVPGGRVGAPQRRRHLAGRSRYARSARRRAHNRAGDQHLPDQSAPRARQPARPAGAGR